MVQCTNKRIRCSSQTHPTICTHHKLRNNNENKIPGFRNVYAISSWIWCNKHVRHTTMGNMIRMGKVDTVYPKKYAHGFVVLCFVVVMQSFIMNSHEVFIHIHQGCFAGTGAIVRLPQCQWSNPDGYGKISRCLTTTKHSKAKTVCIFLGIYCTSDLMMMATRAIDISFQSPKLKWVSWTHTTPYIVMTMKGNR